MEPLHTPPRSDSEPVGAPTPRPYDEPAPGEPGGYPPPERTWTGNRHLARIEPVTSAIIGGLALVVLGFLVLVASLDLRWVVGLSLIALGGAAFVWANGRGLAGETRSGEVRGSDARY